MISSGRKPVQGAVVPDHHDGCLQEYLFLEVGRDVGMLLELHDVVRNALAVGLSSYSTLQRTF
jgi:hypothetical protein